MKNKILIIFFAILLIAEMTTACADRQCNSYSQKFYNELLSRAKNNDQKAMFILSATYCDDCANSLDTCSNDAMKWLEAAAEHGDEQSKLYLKGKNPTFDNLHGDIFYLTQEIKNGDYTFRSYRDSQLYTAYFEILKDNKIIFAPNKHGDTGEYRGMLLSMSLMGDPYPTLEVWPNNGGHADGVEHLYFSLGKDLKCLVEKKSNRIFWPLNRFEEDHSPAAIVALKNGTAELKLCSLIADNLFAD